MTSTPPHIRSAALANLRKCLVESELDQSEDPEGTFVVELPGDRKLSIPCRLRVGEQALGVDAFVCRNPDENHAGVYRWLLARNLRMYGVAFAVDHSGDIYLSGRAPLGAVTPEEIDRLLGSVVAYSDEAFNTILELGFAASIRREWQWRLKRGEPTANLAAFRGWLERDDPDPAG